MGIRLQLILTAYFINPGWALMVQLHYPIADQAIISNVDDAGRIRENTFNKMKEELWTAQYRNRSKERNLYGGNNADKDNETVRIIQEIDEQAPVNNLRIVRQISHELVDSRGVPRIRTKKSKKEKKKKVSRGRKPLNRRERWRKDKLRMRLEYNVTEHYTYETIPITTEKSQLSIDHTIDYEAWNDDEKLRKFLETPYSSEDKDKKYELSALVDDEADDGSLVEDNTVTWMEKAYSSKSPERLQKSSDISDSVVDQKRDSRHRHSSGKDKDTDSHGSERRPSRLSGDENDQLQNNDKNRGKDRIRSRPLNRGKNQTDYWDKEDDETVTFDKNVKSNKRTGKYKKDSEDGRRISSSGKSELTKKGAFWAKQLKLDISKGPKRVRNLISLDDLDT